MDPSNRVPKTAVGGQLSDRMATNTGTLQGTVFSPLSFSIYTTAIRPELFQRMSPFRQADDTVIIGRTGNQQVVPHYSSEIHGTAPCVMILTSYPMPHCNKMLSTTKREAPRIGLL